MNMYVKELREKIGEQAFRMEKAKSNGMMVRQETERMKNILYNNYGAILDALRIADEASERIMELETDLESADRELDKMDDEIKKLREAKVTPKAKAKTKAEPGDAE